MVFSLLYAMEAQFVPGKKAVCPWDQSLPDEVDVLKVYVPFSLATNSPRGCAHWVVGLELEVVIFLLPALLHKLVSDFLKFFAGKFGGKFGTLRDFSDLLYTEERLKNFRENFGAFFVWKFVAQQKSFVQNSLCELAEKRCRHSCLPDCWETNIESQEQQMHPELQDLALVRSILL